MRGMIQGLTFALLAASSCLLTCGAGAGCGEEEETALLAIKHSFNHPNGSALPSWIAGKDCCRWEGVRCEIQRSTDRVTELHLGYTRNASGTWYPNMTLFTHLQTLQKLDLSGNQIGGWVTPEAFCELKKLNALYLRDNLIMGSIPPCVGVLRSLQYLDLSNNQLEGKIPPCVGALRSLQYLNLSNNQLEGKIPSSLFRNLSLITNLRLSDNRFSGRLSFSIFANLSKLQRLSLSNNYGLEIETEYSSWTPSFQLSALFMANCKINQRSLNQFPSFISTQNLVSLDLFNTSISGSISSLIHLLVANSTNATRGLELLEVSQNDIHGSIPDNIALFPNMYLLMMSHNAIHGSIPPSLGNMNLLQILDLSDNNLSGEIPLELTRNASQLAYLIMSHNAIHGSIPPSLGNMNLLYMLDLSNNNLSGEIPLELTRNASQLVYLILSKNSLQGEMLPKDSNLSNMAVLLLNDNSFTGPISSNLSNSPSLTQLDVRNNQLSGDLSTLFLVLRGLAAVLLGGNKLEGQIPKELCQLQALQFLDISNNLFSGNIPSCLNNISLLMTTPVLLYNHLYQDVDFTTKGRLYTYEGLPLLMMTGIDMSRNQLTGIIPSEIGQLKELHSLNLSHNLFSGPLPSSFGKLENIESMDLSYNKLVGNIPRELTQLYLLSTFSVAFNDLSGQIPFEGQFSTFNEESYIGNSQLCGKPLEQNCSSTNSSVVHFKPEEEKKQWIILYDDLFFYSVVAVSYVLAFWATIMFLVFNKKWQAKFCNIVDKCFEMCFSKLFYS